MYLRRLTAWIECIRLVKINFSILYVVVVFQTKHNWKTFKILVLNREFGSNYITEDGKDVTDALTDNKTRQNDMIQAKQNDMIRAKQNNIMKYRDLAFKNLYPTVFQRSCILHLCLSAIGSSPVHRSPDIQNKPCNNVPI